MKKYELLLILPGTLDEKEAGVKSDEVLVVVKEKDADAELVNLGKTRLAYPIKQIRYGYFYTIVFSVDTENLKILQEKLRLMPNLLRVMITDYNEKFSASQKISYVTNESGVTIASTDVDESENKVNESIVRKSEEKVSMQDIDKKLDEILSGDVIPGV